MNSFFGLMDYLEIPPHRCGWGWSPSDFLMLVEGQIEKPWKMIIQSYASKEGIRGDMNSKVGPGFRVSMSWEKLEDLQIQ
jgi:hypothetical protein